MSAPEPSQAGPHENNAQWSALAARMIEDGSRVFQLELRLLELRTTAALTRAVDRAVGALAMVFVGTIGSICLLVAFIFWLHKSFEWWQSLALGGAAAVIVALLLRVSVELIVPRSK